MLDIKNLKGLCHDENMVITKHAKLRLSERNITIDDIKHVINTGEIITQYEDDKPFQSCLILGNSTHNKITHVVVSLDDNNMYVITAYYPDKSIWASDFKKKRSV